MSEVFQSEILRALLENVPVFTMIFYAIFYAI